MFAEKVVQNFRYVKKHPRYANLVSPYIPGQTIILFFLTSKSQLCLDYLPRFTAFAASSPAFTALVTQEYVDTHFPEVMLETNIIADDFTLSAMIPEQLIPTVAIFNSRGKLERTIHPGGFALRGCLNYQANGYVPSKLSSILLKISEFEVGQQQIRLSAELQRKRSLQYLHPVATDEMIHRRALSAPRLRRDFSLLIDLRGESSDCDESAVTYTPEIPEPKPTNMQKENVGIKKVEFEDVSPRTSKTPAKTPKSKSVQIVRGARAEDLHIYDMVSNISLMHRGERHFERYDREYVWSETSSVQDLKPEFPVLQHRFH